jgi:hypothetical protein
LLLPLLQQLVLMHQAACAACCKLHGSHVQLAAFVVAQLGVRIQERARSSLGLQVGAGRVPRCTGLQRKSLHQM